jgi:hypothetical protein
MFRLLKFIVWLAGITVIIYLTLPLFGYEVNLNYFDKSASRCQQTLSDCSKKVLENGAKNTKCDLMCVNPELILKKK